MQSPISNRGTIYNIFVREKRLNIVLTPEIVINEVTTVDNNVLGK